MRTWKDIPELAEKELFLRILEEEGSFERMAKRLSCGRMSVRRAALVHGAIKGR